MRLSCPAWPEEDDVLLAVHECQAGKLQQTLPRRPRGKTEVVVVQCFDGRKTGQSGHGLPLPSLAQIVFTPEDGLQIVNVTAFLLCRDQSVRGGRFPLFRVAVFECTTRPFSCVPRRWFLPVPQAGAEAFL